MLKFNREADSKVLEQAFKKLVEHHDSLRINYNPAKEVLFYNNRHLEGDFSIERYIVAPPASSALLHGAFSELKENFDITKSLLIKAALIREHDAAELLFITAHHLLMDGVSWRIFLADLYTLYNALENGEEVKLPRKTAALTDWERKMTEHWRAQELKLEEKYWNEVESVDFAIPQDLETSEWKTGDVGKTGGTLDREKTDFLLREAYTAYKTDVPVLLNTALALTLREWTGLNTFVVEHENHGRHLESVDVSRTLGWFTAMYPVKLALANDSLGNQIKSIKEQMQGIPHQGMGAKLEINAMVMDAMLRVEISFNRKAHRESTINWFSTALLNHLSAILKYIKNGGEVYFTAADFNATGLDDEDLTALFG